jgi:hypothetical protein
VMRLERATRLALRACDAACDGHSDGAVCQPLRVLSRACSNSARFWASYSQFPRVSARLGPDPHLKHPMRPPIRARSTPTAALKHN